MRYGVSMPNIGDPAELVGLAAATDENRSSTPHRGGHRHRPGPRDDPRRGQCHTRLRRPAGSRPSSTTGSSRTRAVRGCRTSPTARPWSSRWAASASRCRCLEAFGQQVAEGDPVVVLEAMKMEQPINAHKSGTVIGLSAEVGARQWSTARCSARSRTGRPGLRSRGDGRPPPHFVMVRLETAICIPS